VAKPNGSKDNLPWVEKYRPKELNDLVSHQDIISTIKRFMDQKKLPHLLFYGPAGTGKRYQKSLGALVWSNEKSGGCF
jgi:replication-associated recombination protein RarA